MIILLTIQDSSTDRPMRGFHKHSTTLPLANFFRATKSDLPFGIICPACSSCMAKLTRYRQTLHNEHGLDSDGV
jgi:hypothetical protein